MRRDLGIALLILAPIVWFFRIGHAVAGDAVSRFEQLDALVTHGYTMPRAHSLIMPLFSLPMYLLGSVSHDAEWWCARFNVALLAVWLVAMWRALRHEDDDRRLTFLLLVAATSMVPKHMQGYYGEVFTMCAVSWGIAMVHERGKSWGWIAIAIGVANSPALLPAMALLALWACTRMRPMVLHPLAATALALGLYALENYVKRGNQMDTGHYDIPHEAIYSTPLVPSTMVDAFNLPLWIGLYGLLFSIGKGIMWYVPGLWLFPWRPRGMSSDWSVALTVFLVGMFPVYALYTCWHGGWFWGPRYFLLACVPAAWWLASTMAQSYDRDRHRLLCLAIVTLACWVGFTGAVFSQHGLELCGSGEFAYLCWYVPDWTALRRPFAIGSMDVNAWTVAAYIGCVWLWLCWPILRSLAWECVHYVRDVIPSWFSRGLRW